MGFNSGFKGLTCVRLGKKKKLAKVKFNLEQAKWGSRGIAILFNLGARWGWVVNATPRPPYLRGKTGYHCIGGCVGPKACLDR